MEHLKSVENLIFYGVKREFGIGTPKTKKPKASCPVFPKDLPIFALIDNGHHTAIDFVLE